MRRRLSTLAAAISLLVCLVTVVLWARSYRGCDVLIRESSPLDRCLVSSEFGVLVFEIEWPRPAKVQAGWSYFDNPLPRRFGQHDGLLGFAGYTGAARHYLLLPPTVLWGMTMPHWFAFLATAIPPALWLTRRRAIVERRRMNQGCCPDCGYNLKGNTSGTCPECGAPVPRSANSSSIAWSNLK